LVSEQAVDLRLTLAPLRRHRGLLVAAAGVGLVAGLAYALLRPAQYTSTSQVLLPPPTANASGATSSYDTATQVRIAQSAAVLDPAGRHVNPRIGAIALARQLDVSALTSGVIQIKVSAKTAATAQQLAHAVSAAYVAYVQQLSDTLTQADVASLQAQANGIKASLQDVQQQIAATTNRLRHEPANSVDGKSDTGALSQLTATQGQLTAQLNQIQNQELLGSQSLGGSASSVSVIQDASPATRVGLVWQRALAATVGLLVAVAVMAVLLMVFGRRDRRLRSRDELADALGSAVIASLRSRAPRGVSGWIDLMRSYHPGTVDAWALRQALHRLVVGDPAADGRAAENVGDMTAQHPVSVKVITLSNDTRASAMGPQLASYAASLGLDTRLVAAQRQESAAALWAACARVKDDRELRPGLAVDTEPFVSRTAGLTVLVVVLDRRRPELADLPQTTFTILAASSGAGTAEDLAGAAVAAYDGGSPIDWILVADPDPADRTTGRLSQQERSQRVPLPTKLTGASSAGGNATNVTGFRRRIR
jgi:capsular polysaccharide biosynthesis protein